jgi:hypothetical protein
MAFQNRSAKDFVKAHIPDPFSSRIAVNDQVLIIKEENSLFHGIKNRFENRKIHMY